MDDMTRAYLEAAIWTGQDNDSNSLDHAGYTVDDVAPASLSKAMADCAEFLRKVSEADRNAYTSAMARPTWSGLAHMGHDFWLTRNGHGAGFWDRELGALGDRLTALAKTFGQTDIYLGDDELLYLTGGER